MQVVWRVLSGLGALLVAILAITLALPFLALILVLISTWLAYRIYRRTTNGHPWHWLRTKLGWGRNIKELARRIGWDPDQLSRFEPAYREVFIAKRSGGQRRLLVPDDRTKALQRSLLRRVLRRLRAHPAATGFERGRSIVDHARPHVWQGVVICLDIVDFFPTTTADRVAACFQRIGWNRDTAALLTRLTTHDGGLPQGAPTSPRLSNLVNFRLDAVLARYVKRRTRKGQYTRYADDIVLSFPRDFPRRVRGTVQYVRRLLKAHGYQMHERRKLHVRRRHQRQIVTSLVVNERVQLPRETRRWLRAVEHRQRTGRSATLTPQQLAGWHAFMSMLSHPLADDPSSQRH